MRYDYTRSRMRFLSPMDDTSSATCVVSDNPEDEAQPPSPKKAKLDAPRNSEPKRLLGLVDHQEEPPGLPVDWVAVPHVSGATVYLHQPTRVVTFSRPYHVSTSKTIRKHSVCVQSVPCLEQWLFGGRGDQEKSDLAQSWQRQADNRPHRLVKIAPERLREYLALRWEASQLAENSTRSSVQGEKRGDKEREREKEVVKKKETQQKKSNPIIPESLSKVVKVKIPSDYRKLVKHAEGKTPPPVWEVNLASKNATAILHEFCQLYFHTSPSFSFSNTKGPPYSCEVKVGGVKYGTGKADTKRVAKVTAAAETLDLFLPGTFPSHLLLPDNTHSSSSSTTSSLSEEGLQLLSELAVEAPEAPSILSQTGFPSPWQTLRNSLTWNQGFLPDKLTLDLLPLTGEGHTSSSAENHNFECVLRCGEEVEGEEVLEVRVTCMGRRDGQQAAAQAMLKKIHPYITNWGSLLRLYSRTPPLSSRQPEHPPPATEGCGLLSDVDQQLLRRLRESMSQLAREREGEKKKEKQTSEKQVAGYLHEAHIRHFAEK